MIVNIYGFKNEIEYRYPNKIIDCNLQVYIIDNIEYKLEEFYKINLSDEYFISKRGCSIPSNLPTS